MAAGTGVAVVGVGLTRHGFLPQLSWKDLIVESAFDAMEDAGIEPSEIDGGFVSVAASETIEQSNLGSVGADELGLVPNGFAQIVAACASGTVALQAGVNAIASGRFRRILVVGFEKFSDTMAASEGTLANVDHEFEAPAGFDYVDSIALVHARYMQKYGASPESIARFAVQDRWYGRRNPKAMYSGAPELTVDDVLDSRIVSYPITRVACGAPADGSSAVVLMPADEAHQFPHAPVLIGGIAQATGPNVLATKFGHPGAEGTDIAEALPTTQAARRAFQQAGVGPQDVDLAQVHDCFTIMGIIHLEGLGIFPVGKGAAAVEAGETSLDGRCPTNTDGGRIALGHPPGATGINIVVESVLQMRGCAGERQVPKADVAVCQSMGGNNATSAVVVLQRVR